MTVSTHLGDLSSQSEYRVRLEFTQCLDPSILADGLPYVSLLTEIEANSSDSDADELRERYGRIPYGSPLYWWETHSSSGVVECAYIGKTVKLELQKRFEQHATLLRLLAKHVNAPEIRVMFRLCSRFDILSDQRRFAIEHLPSDQAANVVADVEAYLIHRYQPVLNTHYRGNPKPPWKPFDVEDISFS